MTDFTLFDGKVCIDCRNWFELGGFPRNCKSRDGRAGRCKACNNARSRAEYRRCIEARKEYDRKRRPIAVQRNRARMQELLSDPDARSRYNERQKKYYAVHAEKHRALARSYYLLNKDAIKRYITQWRVENKAKCCIYGARKRANKLNADGTFTSEEWDVLCKRFGNICLACGKRSKLTIDHVIPLSKGGMHSLNNVQPLCGSCNSKKKDHTIDYRHQFAGAARVPG